MDRKLRPVAILWAALTALALSGGAGAAAEPAEDAVAAARKAVAEKEEGVRQVAELARKDEASPAAVDRARLALAEAQLALARAEKDAGAEKAALGKVVECREAVLKRLTSAVNLGIVARAELDCAERDKAAAAAELARAEGDREALIAELTKCCGAHAKQVARVKAGAALGLYSGADLRKAQIEMEAVRRQLAEAKPKTPTPKPPPKPKPPDEVF